jgi:hypothetical protein
MEQKNPLVEAAAEFLSLETSSKPYKSIDEQEDKAVTDSVNKEVGEHPDSYELPMHLAKTSSGHHVYHHHTDPYKGRSDYVVHHPDGKITKHTVDHDNKKVKAKELSEPHTDWHNVSGLHSSVRKVIHKDVNSNVDDEYNY